MLQTNLHTDRCMSNPLTPRDVVVCSGIVLSL